MPSANINVPSVEEMRSRMTGVRSTPATVKELQTELSKLRQENDLLKSRGRLTPAEMRYSLMELMEKKGINPAVKLIEMTEETDAQGRPALTNDQKIKVYTELMGYQMPKLKATELSGVLDMNLRVVIKQYAPDGTTVSEKPVVNLTGNKLIGN